MPTKIASLGQMKLMLFLTADDSFFEPLAFVRCLYRFMIVTVAKSYPVVEYFGASSLLQVHTKCIRVPAFKLCGGHVPQRRLI